MPGCYVVFHKQLGDLLLLQPALLRLRDHHGEPVAVMTRSGHTPLLDLMDGIRFQHAWTLKRKSHLYCFDPLRKSAIRSFLTQAGVKQCILPEKRELEWYHRPLFGDVIVPELGDRYVAEYFWANTPVPSGKPFCLPKLNAPAPNWKPSGVDSSSYVLINPTSGWRKKMWTTENWVKTLRALHAEHNLRFVMTSASTPWQVEHCQEIAQQAGPIVQSLASGTSLENFLWLCANARAVLTVDGAASHLAQAFGVKSLTLFGPTNIHNWHFETPTNQAIQAPEGKDGRRMRNLSAEAVITAARSLRPD